jgi:hypothetical protein
LDSEETKPIRVIGFMPDEEIRYSFLEAHTRHPLPSRSSDAADFAEPKPVTDLVVIRANEAYAAMGAG